MSNFSLLIKPASSLCNLRCRYCFYADISNHREINNFGIMSRNSVDCIITNVMSDYASGDQLTFAFQGGEPTLAGLDWFRYFVAKVKEVAQSQNKAFRINYSLQTNGMIIDKDWCEFLAQNHFLVGLSLDGDAELHNANRVDAQLAGTHSRVMQTKRLLDEHGVEYNVLWVLTNQTARYPKRVWRFLCENNIRFVQFIPCLNDLEELKGSRYALEPNRFASFYTGLLKFWTEAFVDGKYISINFFDNIFNLLTHRMVTACGFTGQCQMQFVVEADGSVYPCDFYALDSYRAGSLVTQTPSEIRHSDVVDSFLARPRTNSTLCEKCRWRNMCGGGCIRMRRNMYLNQNASRCGYQMFLDSCKKEIAWVAHWLLNH